MIMHLYMNHTFKPDYGIFFNKIDRDLVEYYYDLSVKKYLFIYNSP